MPGNSRYMFGNATAVDQIHPARSGQQQTGNEQPGGRLPSFSVNTEDFAPDERCDVWSEICSPNYHMRSVGGEALDLHARITAQTIGELTIGDLVFLPRNESGCSVSFNSNGSELVALRYCTNGGIQGAIADAAVDQSPDNIYLLDQRPDFHGVTYGMRQLSIYIPYQLIGYDPSRDPAARAFATNTPVGRMLQTIITSAVASVSDVTAAESDAFSAGLEGAIRGLLKAERGDERTRSDFEMTRKDAMRTFIRKNIANPDLSVADVCAVFGTSRATAFRAFKSSGGIQRYIVNRRLDRAYELLSRSPESRGRVIQVAHECGFRDTSLFFRSFRARFAMPPGDVLGQNFTGHGETGSSDSRTSLLHGEQLFFKRLFG